jgi:Ca-activated chloride channel family protein
MKTKPGVLSLTFLFIVLPGLLAAIVLHSGCATRRPVGVTRLPGARSGPSPLGYVSSREPLTAGLRHTAGAWSPVSDELWIIARGTEPQAQPTEEAPGTGALLATVDEKEVPMPLKHTDVRASISGFIGEVAVTQQFHNPYDRKIEAIYVFPLPHNAAVNEFIMTIGKRRIRGIIRERKEAEQIYQEAKRQGFVASLLTEERPNIFTQSVANVEPGKEIEVDIKYFHTLKYVNGWYEFVFPMVVGPRFNPPGMTNGIGAAPRTKPGASSQNAEVSYLRPGERSDHNISLKVDVDAGVPIEDFECKTHQVTSVASAPGHLSVALDPADALPNKDFVLRYRVAGDRIKSSLLTHRDERGGFFTLMLYPPQELQALHRQPLELVFVLDCSGSMSGRPIEQAKAAVRRALSLLEPGDSFQLISFSITASQLGRKPLEATPANVRHGLNYLASLQGEGGTMMIEGIKAALDFPHDPQRLRFVCFLTDGYIDNEAEILGEIHKRLGSSRIFSFGIGSSVNRYLIDSMAKAGRGAVAYLRVNEDAAPIMEDFFERISHPALTDPKIDWGGLHVTDIFPGEVPDLFVGRPVILTGRFAGDQPTTIRVNGTAAGQPVQVAIPADVSDMNATHKALPSVWARMKIASLTDDSTQSQDSDVPAQIRQVALDYGLMSAFTAFVAVDSARITEGGNAATVPVAVPVPDGVNYDKTVEEEQQ